jgi:hypothetical protein
LRIELDVYDEVLAAQGCFVVTTYDHDATQRQPAPRVSRRREGVTDRT